MFQFSPSLLLKIGSIGLLCFATYQARASLLQSHRNDLISNFSQKPMVGFCPSKSCALGFEQLSADLLWIDFIQYIGDPENSHQSSYSRQVEQYLESISILDPKFIPVYYFAVLTLGGECHQPALAEKLVKEGQIANPLDWKLQFLAGVNRYLYAHDPLTASTFYRRASTMSGAPQWLKGQSEILAKDIPGSIKQTNVWTQVLNSTDDAVVKQTARVQLINLWVKVYREAPSENIRARAASQLSTLGVKVEDLKSRSKFDF
ncbi:MAG: hypothetical protein P4L53_11410 [Candidatus Obscuribacterales bacterium]|nr:hypothetical protein [Candidatus Obscuribacterales bacterium]